MTSSQDQPNSAFGRRQLDAEWQEMLLQARDKPWLLRLLARQGAEIVARYALWKQRLARLRTGERRRLRQRLGVSIGGAALVLALMAGPAQAAGITVDAGGVCTLAEAITSANNDNAAGNGCVDGSGADTITLQTNVGLTAALPAITTAITIEGGGNTIAGNNSFGILNVTSSGNLTLNSATISGGSASTGGGIYNRGAVTVQNSTLSANSANYGGGIYNRGTVTVQNSTLSANLAFVGGGIFNFGTLTVQNSTLSANSAGYYGGGIYNRGTVTVQNSTLSANSAFFGGGIYNTGGAVTVQNSIVALQTAGGDCSGSITTGGYNIASDSTCGFTSTGDQQNTNPLLGPLANNGGPTLTHFPLTNSPALDRGSCVGPTDQRGDTRPVDLNDAFYPNGTGGACDVGAVEAQGVGPNAVTLRDFTAASASGGGLAGWALGALAALGLGAVFGRRRRRNDDGLGQSGRSPLAQTDAEPDPGRWPYQPPAIVHRGRLELRAGSPLALPDFMDPDNPFP